MKDALNGRSRKVLASKSGLYLLALLIQLVVWSSSLSWEISSSNIDLGPTYLAGRLWQERHDDSIYQPSVFVTEASAAPVWLARWLEVSDNIPLRETSFVGHPCYLAAISPITSVTTLKQFTTLAFIVNAICITSIGWQSVAWAGIQSQSKRFLGALLAGILPFSIYGAALGQTIAIILALLMLATSMSLGNKTGQFIGGLLIAAAITIKPWALLFLPLPALSGRWVTFATAALTTLLMFIAAHSPLFSPELRSDHAAMNATLLESHNLAFNNVSLRAFFERVADPEWGSSIASWTPRKPPTQAVVFAIITALVVALAAALPAWRRRSDPRLLLSIALPLSLIPLGIVWTHYLILLIPGLWRIAFTAKTIISQALSWGAVAFLAFFPIHRTPIKTHFLIDTPSPSQITESPHAWALWFLLPLLMALACACALLHSSTSSTAR
jgi:hypothetical protein